MRRLPRTIIDNGPRRRSQQGAALAEYGLLVVLIAVVCFAAVVLLGANINVGLFQAAAGI